ncbi:MAG TPA: hypothetical protein DCF33_03530 [Saprospirales bacterium]|nr:hypothetical protein [Saprospirales bacterium]
MNIKFVTFLLVQVLLLSEGCSSAEKETVRTIALGPSDIMPKDSCYAQVNKALISLLNNSEALQKHLNVTEADARQITNPSAKTNAKRLKHPLIEKLIPIIADTTDLKLPYACSALERARLGDLALLCIYRLENFPFAHALGRQWCTGGAMSDNIMLPHDLIGYTNFERSKIKSSYQTYYIKEVQGKHPK